MIIDGTLLPFTPTDTADHPATDPSTGSVVDSNFNVGCTQYDALQDAVVALQGLGTVTYNPVAVIGPGENSDWFAWWIINYADIYGLGIPPNAPGFVGTQYSLSVTSSTPDYQ